MCLIVFALHHHPSYPLILAANRDEFYSRPTSRAHFWDDHPGVLAGRDLKYGGTWMGVTRSGRFAAITNFRDMNEFREHPLSRGLMVKDYLTGIESPHTFLEEVISREDRYNGFNIILGDITDLFYYSNRSREIKKIQSGVHGLSNHLLDTPWPKLVKSRQKLEEYLKMPGVPDVKRLFEILSDRDLAPDEKLPHTGFGRKWERVLSAPFITTPTYGTRASTVLIADNKGNVSVKECSFAGPEDPGIESSFTFTINGGW